MQVEIMGWIKCMKKKITPNSNHPGPSKETFARMIKEEIEEARAEEADAEENMTVSIARINMFKEIMMSSTAKYIVGAGAVIIILFLLLTGSVVTGYGFHFAPTTGALIFGTEPTQAPEAPEEDEPAEPPSTATPPTSKPKPAPPTKGVTRK